MRPERARDDPARLLVQLAARRVSLVPGPWRDVGLRPGANRAGSVAHAPGRRDGTVEQRRRDARPGCAPHARGHVRHRARRAVREAAEKHRDVLLSGPGLSSNAADPTSVPKRRPRARAAEPYGRDFEGVIPNLRRRYEEGTWTIQEELERYRSLRPCPDCGGARLKPESLAVRVKGRTIQDYVSLPVCQALEAFNRITLTDRETIIAERILREVQDRLRFLDEVGVGYLSLGRSAATLSGGEGQRIRLATQIGSNLTGVLYVLDEPSIGLHQRDNRALLGTLQRLRDLGNSVLVVEHDEETIRTADYVVDLGPGAGEHGGRVIFQGTPAELIQTDRTSLTGAYLRGELGIDTPRARRPSLKGEIVIHGARATNLKNVDVAIPLGVFTA